MYFIWKKKTKISYGFPQFCVRRLTKTRAAIIYCWFISYVLKTRLLINIAANVESFANVFDAIELTWKTKKKEIQLKYAIFCFVLLFYK